MVDHENPVRWFEIYVDDIARARRFYEAVLQVTFQPITGFDDAPDDGGVKMLGFPSKGPEATQYGANGALVHMPGLKAGGASTIVYFGCADCAVEAGRVAAAGGAVFKPKFSIGPYGFCALVTDTEGNMIGLHSMA